MMTSIHAIYEFDQPADPNVDDSVLLYRCFVTNFNFRDHEAYPQSVTTRASESLPGFKYSQSSGSFL